MKRVSGRTLFVGLLVLLGLGVALTTCFPRGNDEPVAPLQELIGETVLACSALCAQQGQCGQAVDGRLMVLGHPDHPETYHHAQLFPVDVPVTIEFMSEQRIQSPGAEPIFQPFSLIIVNHDGKRGWVADSCVSRLPAP